VESPSRRRPASPRQSILPRHAPEPFELDVAAVASIEVICTVAISCWLKVLRTVWRPLESGTRGQLTYVSYLIKLTHMEKTQVYLRKEELDALRKVAARSRRSVAALVREAVRKVVLMPAADGPVAIWDGKPKRSSLDHDSVHDEP